MESDGKMTEHQPAAHKPAGGREAGHWGGVEATLVVVVLEPGRKEGRVPPPQASDSISTGGNRGPLRKVHVDEMGPQSWSSSVRLSSLLHAGLPCCCFIFARL